MHPPALSRSSQNCPTIPFSAREAGTASISWHVSITAKRASSGTAHVYSPDSRCQGLIRGCLADGAHERGGWDGELGRVVGERAVWLPAVDPRLFRQRVVEGGG